MELKQLYYFCEAAKTGSFSQAAEKNFITQQGLSKSVSRLEKELGVPLFIREASGVRLTLPGRFLQKQCEDIFARLEETASYLRQLPVEDPRTSVISSAFGVRELLLENGIENYNTQSPEHPVTVIGRSDFQCEEDVLSRAADGGITIYPQKDNLLSVLPLTREALCVMAGTRHPLALREQLRLKDLDRADLILVSELERSNQSLLRLMELHGLHPGAIHAAPNLLAAMKLCQDAKGVAVLLCALQNMFASPNIVFIPLKEPVASWDLYFIYRKDTDREAELLSFYRFMREELCRLGHRGACPGCTPPVPLR